jgi:type IV pilus secretin PilQ/predicted competence protein
VNGSSSASRFTPLALALLLLVGATAGPAPVAAAPAGATRLITLDAEDAPLASVLKILAEKGDLNIITGTGANTASRLTIHMKDVPLDQAVNLVVRAAGLAYERIGNSILVAEARALQEETGLSSYVVDLKYAAAEDVKGALRNIAENVQVDKSGNRLVVVTSPRVISQIEEIVRVMDVPARQVVLEARILEVSTGDAMQLGIDWDRLNRQGVVIVEGGSGATRQGTIPDSLPFFGAGGSYPNMWSLRGMSRQAFAWQTTIDLLIRTGKARVLANPKIATLNGREASILIGERIPFTVTGTVFAGGAAAETRQVEKEEVGIKLKITPLINADGYITTQITPEVSSVTGYKGVNGDLPVVATRQASTTVRLKDGDSVIIGGLLSEEETTNITKVPLLGDIPLLGFLFQHRGVSTSKRDLVIEVTPHIMPEQR